MKRLLILAAIISSASAIAAPGDGDIVNILRGSDARQQLALSVDKIAKLDELFGLMERKIAEMVNKARPDVKIGGFSVGKAPDPFNMAEKIQGEFRTQMVKMLDATQLQQALKLGIKAEGNFAFLMPEVSKQIPLDRDAKKGLEGYRKEYLDLKKLLDGQVRKGTLTDEMRISQLSAKDAELQQAIATLVKPELLDKLKALAN